MTGAVVATLTHTIALLAEPSLRSPVVALLDAGAIVEARPAERGFAQVQRADGAIGYLPMALLGAGPADHPRLMTVMFSAVLFPSASTSDSFGTRPIVARDEIVRIYERTGNFVRAKRANGQAGYLPHILCRPLPALHGQAAQARVLQAVAFYDSPEPGGQYDSAFQIEPGEPLSELGRSDGFVLVQRHTGQVGFVLAGLCGEPAADKIMPLGPLDLGWLAIGAGWWVVNWGGMGGILARAGVTGDLRRYSGLVLAFGIAAALWLLAHRKQAARSLALGALLVQMLLYLEAR